MDEALYHHGVKGQKWGVRRYQNEDGSYTEAGRLKYGKQAARKYYKIDRLERKRENTHITFGQYQRAGKSIRKTRTRYDRKIQGLSQRDIEVGRQRVASFRSKRKTVTAIASSAALVAGMGVVASMNPVGIPMVVLGGSGLGSSLNRKIYYSEEARRYKKGHGSFVG